MLLLATLSAMTLAIAPAQEPERKGPTDEQLSEAIDAAVALLLERQESYEADRPVGTLPDDELESWQEGERERLAGLYGDKDAAEWPYEGVYRVRGGIIPSGYRVGGTSIVCDTLLRAGAGGEDAEALEEAVERSADFVLDMIKRDKGMAIGPKRGYDVRGWGHAYALQFFLTLREVGPSKLKKSSKIKGSIKELIKRLEANQTAMGGWNYANDRAVSPFMTGSTLLILFDAKEAGHDVDEDMVERALDALEACRTEAVSYAYSGKARGEVLMPGSSARSACAELALYKAGRSDADELRKAVVGFFEGYDDLLVRKSQQGTHVGKYGIAPYYFFFGHTYVALAIEELPEAERDAHRAELRRLIWSTRNDDGSWNDRVFPRTASYSTAMILQALQAPERGAFAGWESSAKAKKKRRR